jgi:hypothetical protein
MCSATWGHPGELLSALVCSLFGGAGCLIKGEPECDVFVLLGEGKPELSADEFLTVVDVISDSAIIDGADIVTDPLASIAV